MEKSVLKDTEILLKVNPKHLGIDSYGNSCQKMRRSAITSLKNTQFLSHVVFHVCIHVLYSMLPMLKEWDKISSGRKYIQERLQRINWFWEHKRIFLIRPCPFAHFGTWYWTWWGALNWRKGRLIEIDKYRIMKKFEDFGEERVYIRSMHQLSIGFTLHIEPSIDNLKDLAMIQIINMIGDLLE